MGAGTAPGPCAKALDVTRIAVTGGSGKAGRVVVRDLAERGHEVLNIDRAPSPESNAPDSEVPFLAPM